LQHAIVNLLNNAADASLANGDARVEMTARADGDILEIQVRDHGRGMRAASAAASGFGFQTTKHDGLGLGLALANATAERFGGTLNAVAAAGGGTRQCLRLPLPRLDNPPHEH
jgi:two-component system sensor histidine kinase RegB